MPDNPLDGRFLFLMAGGGTGGHVIPLLAVANELRARGHEAFFVGTARGAEARLVPAAGFPLEFIRAGGLQRMSAGRKVTAILDLIRETLGQFSKLGKRRPDAIFSLGGYVAGPPVLAALLRRIPIAIMEPNALPGLTNRWVARYVKRALVNFPETSRYFPAGCTDVTGVPVREAFFHLPPRPMGTPFTVLITGGSQGSRTLNQAARAVWPLFRESARDVYFIHQTGASNFETLSPEFRQLGVSGEISAFIDDMPAAYARADLIICRAGAGTVSELAAAGKPSILIPFPFAADNHQLHNAERFREAGAALLYADREWTGKKMFEIISELFAHPERLQTMAIAARSLAHPGAACRAADILEEIARKTH
jgi:UDP-N-acetylglucosamine--N-acetylmuramyl-(pentapeptide) pyrophosphoryl-undecaprenol N-acetylglucosamine transferase